MNNTLLKFEGREAVHGRRRMCFYLMASKVAVSFLCSCISYYAAFDFDKAFDAKLLGLPIVLLISAMWYMTSSSLEFGEEAWHCCLSNKRNPSISHVLYWFRIRHSLKALLLNILTSAKKLLWTAIFSLPGMVLLCFDFAIVRDSNQRAVFTLMFVGGLVSLMIGMIFAFCINQRYFMAKYLLVKNPKMNIRDAKSISIQMMDGKCMKTAWFKISFMPLAVCCLLLFPCIYVVPYCRHACVCMKREISGSFSLQRKQG